MVSFISAFHSCTYLLVYPVLRAGLPACVLKEQVLNLPLWEGYGAKINSEALNFASGSCQRRYVPSLEALISDTQLAGTFCLVLPCSGVWKITASQRRVLHGGLWEVHHVLQPSDLGTSKFPLLKWKSGDANKFLHRYTRVLAVLYSIAYTFRTISEVSQFSFRSVLLIAHVWVWCSSLWY